MGQQVKGRTVRFVAFHLLATVALPNLVSIGPRRSSASRHPRDVEAWLGDLTSKKVIGVLEAQPTEATGRPEIVSIATGHRTHDPSPSAAVAHPLTLSA